MRTRGRILAIVWLAGNLLQQTDGEKEISRGLRRGSAPSLDPKTVQAKEDTIEGEKSRRKFVSYHPSTWEQMWLDNIEEWGSKRTVCEELTQNQAQFAHDFLNLTCTSRFLPPHENWCLVDDTHHPMYYDTFSRERFVIHFENPLPESARLANANPQPVVPTEHHRHILSYFIFLDEVTGEQFVEYIEPLVSHLRWPLSHCVEVVSNNKYRHVTHRGYVIPPPPPRHRWYQKAVFYDAGSSSWSEGAGGASLSYFWQVWNRHGITFDEIYAYDLKTTEEAFRQTVPDGFHDFVHFKQCRLVSQPDLETNGEPFVPGVIRREASKDDYIMFKLDIDAPQVEAGNIEYILNDPNNIIDEVFWEHHIRGNYLMTEWGNPDNPGLDDYSLRDSYELFLRMRQMGIRAHSWI